MLRNSGRCARAWIISNNSGWGTDTKEVIQYYTSSPRLSSQKPHPDLTVIVLCPKQALNTMRTGVASVNIDRCSIIESVPFVGARWTCENTARQACVDRQSLCPLAEHIDRIWENFRRYGSPKDQLIMERRTTASGTVPPWTMLNSLSGMVNSVNPQPKQTESFGRPTR